MSDEAEECKCPEGVPGWIVTFADLMSLLLTFFILLLSFAEMDMRKFKKAVGSIKNAFGVQTKGLYENSVTSNNPFKDAYGKGSKEWMDMGFSQPQLSISDDHFCELEQQRKIAALQDLRLIQEKLEKSIGEAKLKYMRAFIENGTLKVRLQQSLFFEAQSEKPRKEALSNLSQVIRILNQEGMNLSLKLTSYSPRELDATALPEWRLSVQRTALLGYLTQQVSQNNIKDISVRNLIADTKNHGAPQNIDLYVDLHQTR